MGVCASARRSSDIGEGVKDMLTLPIKKKWFDMILSGEKKEEYRAMKSYYHSRFENIGLLNRVLEPTDAIRWIKFRNGYSTQSPSFYARVKIRMGEGKPEWGAEPGKDYWILEILDIDTEGKRNGKTQSACAIID